MKESLNSDGQQFHQNEQPPLTSNQQTRKGPQQIELGIQVLACGIFQPFFL